MTESSPQGRVTISGLLEVLGTLARGLVSAAPFIAGGLAVASARARGAGLATQVLLCVAVVLVLQVSVVLAGRMTARRIPPRTGSRPPG